MLFVDHYGISGNLRAIAIARDYGIPVVADLERDNVPRFYEMLPLIDHLIVGRRFAAKLTGNEDPAEAVVGLMSEDRKVTVVTAGDEGCWYCDGGESSGICPRLRSRLSTPQVAATSSTVFYAAAMAQGIELEESTQS